MSNLKFKYADLFLAPRLGLGPKNLWLQTRGVFYAVLTYAAFSYAALGVSGQDLYRYWSSYYLFPPLAILLDGVTLAFWGYVLWALGVVIAAAILLNSMTEVAKVTVERLRGNDFYATREAAAFRRKHWKSVMLTPAVVGTALVLLLTCLAAASVVARIPVVGDVLASLAFLPAAAVALLIILIAGVFVLSLAMTPALVAATGDDPFECAFELFAVATSQSWRLILYFTTTSVLSLVGAAVAGGWAAAAIAAARGTYNLLGGYRTGEAIGAAVRVLPSCLRGAYPGGFPPLVWLSSRTGEIGSFAAGAAVPLPWPQAVAATIYALVLLFTLTLVAAYTINVFTCGQTITYLVLRKKKDDENLLELYDEDIEKTVLEMNESGLRGK